MNIRKTVAVALIMSAGAVLALTLPSGGQSNASAQVQACSDLFGTQFVPVPDSIPIWTDPACAGLSRDDQARAYAYTIIDYARKGEQRRAAQISRAGITPGVAK